MESWPKVPIGDLFKLKQGTYLKPEDMSESQTDYCAFPVYGANGIIGYSSRKMYGDRTALISCRGANCGVVHYTVPNVWISNNSIACVPKADVDPTFYYYVLHNTDFGDVITGSAQPQITITNLSSKEFIRPPLPIQRRIASTLSAYDDLIENHRKRIAILEEMARRLYREWFVHFRYPGHEAVPMVESPLGPIPPGWKATTLAAVCSGDGGIQTGPFGSQLHESDYSPSGVPVVMPRILIRFRIDATNADHIPEETAQRLSRHRMLPGDIVYGRRGDIGRRAFISQKYAGWFCGTGCLRIRPNPGIICPFYLFNHLGQDEVLGNIRGRAQGVTLPNLSASVMESVPITVPPRPIQEAFESAALPMQELAENLHDQIDILRRTRDLLLPRLMSGTLSVEALATAEAAVP